MASLVATGGLEGGFIEPEWLEAVAGTTFLYPAAGADTQDFISLLAPEVERFVFNDLNYSTLTDRRVPVPEGWRLVSRSGDNLAARHDRLQPRHGEDREHRDLSPSLPREVHEPDGRAIGVARVGVLADLRVRE